MFDDEHDDSPDISRTFAYLLALAMFLAPAAIFAEEPLVASADAFAAEASSVPSFSTLDVNGDGVISLGEAQAHPELAAVFQEADKNGDGVLDRAEFQTALRLIEQA
jgi:hypothetical protein